MHNYAGNPSNFPVSIPLVDDADLNPPDATNIDLTGQGLADRTAWLFANQISSWNVPFTVAAVTGDSSAGSASFQAACWDPLNGRWLIAAAYSSHDLVAVWAAYDGADGTLEEAGSGYYNFNNVTGKACIAQAVLADPTQADNFWLASIDATDVLLYYNDGSAWHAVANGTITGTTAITGIALCYFSGQIIEAIGSSGSSNTTIISGGSNFASVSALAPGFAVEDWIVKASGTQVVAVGANQTFTTPFVYTSPDGVTWTKQTTSIGTILASTDEIVGLDWGADAIGPCWILLAVTNTGTTKVVRSGDGINWTLVATLAHELVALCSVTTSGRTWYTVQTADAQEAYRIGISFNGGSVWNQTASVVPPVPASGSQLPVLVGSPNQALAFSAFAMRTSGAKAYGSPIT
jgi:hypothetical protein